MRRVRPGTVAGVLVWKLVALALLPAALCCQAVAVADGTVPACCEGGHEGAACPLALKIRSYDDHDRQATHDKNPAIAGCELLDDALLEMVSLTGFIPQAVEFSVPLAESGAVAMSFQGESMFGVGPLLPPPRV